MLDKEYVRVKKSKMGSIGEQSFIALAADSWFKTVKAGGAPFVNIVAHLSVGGSHFLEVGYCVQHTLPSCD
jgi:hypothetical protein